MQLRSLLADHLTQYAIKTSPPGSIRHLLTLISHSFFLFPTSLPLLFRFLFKRTKDHSWLFSLLSQLNTHQTIFQNRITRTICVGQVFWLLPPLHSRCPNWPSRFLREVLVTAALEVESAAAPPVVETAVAVAMVVHQEPALIA